MPRKVVTVAYIAMRCMQHDTVVALAFRKALGIVGAVQRSGGTDEERGQDRSYGDAGVYDGMAECFENRRRVRL